MGISVFPEPAGASPYGGTITNLGVVQGGGTSTVTITGLGAYKRVVIYWQGIDSNGSTNFRFRINSDSNDNYAFEGVQYATSVASIAAVRANAAYLAALNGSGPNGSDATGVLILENSNSNAYKIGNFSSTAVNNSGTRFTRQNSFIWTSTAAITSVSFINDSSTFNVQSGTTAGFYAIGYN
jgi:hypothetical protein